MVLVDTSVWIDHLRKGEPALRLLLQQEQVLMHPFILGEIAMGNLKNRKTVLDAMQDLPAAVVAQDEEVLQFVTDRSLSGLGIGYIDAHLLASAKITAHCSLWTRDRRLATIASQLSLIYSPR